MSPRCPGRSWPCLPPGARPVPSGRDPLLGGWGGSVLFCPELLQVGLGLHVGRRWGQCSLRVVALPPPRGQPGREDRPTLRLLAATNLCFAERNVYTSEVLAVVMQQLMEQSPLPMLLMRTVIQSLTMYPRLGGFVMNILSRLIMKQVTRPDRPVPQQRTGCSRTLR